MNEFEKLPVMGESKYSSLSYGKLILVILDGEKEENLIVDKSYDDKLTKTCEKDRRAWHSFKNGKAKCCTGVTDYRRFCSGFYNTKEYANRDDDSFQSPFFHYRELKCAQMQMKLKKHTYWLGEHCFDGYEGYGDDGKLSPWFDKPTINKIRAYEKDIAYDRNNNTFSLGNRSYEPIIVNTNEGTNAYWQIGEGIIRWQKELSKKDSREADRERE